MENKTKKKPILLIGKLIKGVFKNPLIRGGLKTTPGGSFAYELAENVKYWIKKKRGENVSDKAPHSAISLIAQLVLLSLIVYAFVTKQLTIDDLLKWFSIDDFKEFYPVNGEVLKDSI